MSDEVQPRRRFPRLSSTAMYIVAWLAFLTSLAGLVARFMPVTSHIILIVAALSPYLMLFAGLSAALLLLTRQWWTAAAALMLVAAVVFVELPLFIGSNRAPANSMAIRVLTANAYQGSAHPRALVAIARERADLLVLQELTPELASSLANVGIDSDFPYAALGTRTESAGVGIWSRYPIVRSRLVANYELGMVSAVIRPPDAADDAVVLAAHLTGPWPQPIDSWYEELANLPETLSEILADAGEGAAIVAGDFNATIDMEPFRQLLRGGFRDAAEQSGAGLAGTYPANSTVPPLLSIDHILTHNSSATDVQTIPIPGSDHLGLLATVHIPR